ncbi:serpin-ZXA-like isoform X2 [Magnolia sinica]|uniref:serpin-ZXA-like isoform X2 n=1 Tax=Magnolia sinica TaxID=86752 RepID=UPI0026597CD3|nr:serpin-ZXA-like isoform X2 [Magnolia sinica]
MASPQPASILNTDFCLQIAKHVGLKEIEKGLNFGFSPLSVHVVLSMIATGSKGHTLEQMLQFLKSESIEELNSLSSRLVHLISADGAGIGGPHLSFTNGIWVEQSFPLKPAFRDIVNSIYKAEARAIDFRMQADKVAHQVNSWIKSSTNGLIKELLPSGSLDRSTMLVLANAIYFKGAWSTMFDGSKTQDRDFFLLDGSISRAAFMASNKKKHFLHSFDGFKVLKLPYQHGNTDRRFSMYFILPHKRYGLPNLIKNFDLNSGFLGHHLKLWEVEAGRVQLPRFKISFGLEASGIIKELGLYSPFSKQGGLTEMVDYQELFVSKIFHKSFVGVNEEGTEAAAATAALVAYNCSSSRLHQMDFVADHPFMFMIKEEVSGVVLFIGNVLNPSYKFLIC